MWAFSWRLITMEVDSESRKRSRGEIENSTVDDAPMDAANGDAAASSGPAEADDAGAPPVQPSSVKRTKFIPSERTVKRSKKLKDRRTASDWSKIKRVGKGKGGANGGAGKPRTKADKKLAQANAEWAVGTAASKKDFLKHKNEEWEAYYKVGGVRRCLTGAGSTQRSL